MGIIIETKSKYAMPRERWHSCSVCMANLKTTGVIPFDTGTSEPAVGEVLTGGSSGFTGTVNEIQLVSGTWVGGDAAGNIGLDPVTGIDSNGHIGEDNESVTGSISASLTMNGTGTKKTYGIQYPESLMVYNDDEGEWYCKAHYHWKFDRKEFDEIDTDFSEGENDGT